MLVDHETYTFKISSTTLPYRIYFNKLLIYVSKVFVPSDAPIYTRASKYDDFTSAKNYR